MDLSTLSDADLTALYHQSSNPLASLSNDELKIPLRKHEPERSFDSGYAPSCCP